MSDLYRTRQSSGLLIGLAGSSTGETWLHFNLGVAVKDRVLLGRAEECTVVLADRQCSRIHAAFEYANETLVIRDIGSANGTWVDGQKIERALLQVGSAIQLGVTSLRVESLREGWNGEQQKVWLGGQQCPGCRRFVDVRGVCGRCMIPSWSEAEVPTEVLQVLPTELRHGAPASGIDDGVEPLSAAWDRPPAPATPVSDTERKGSTSGLLIGMAFASRGGTWYDYDLFVGVGSTLRLGRSEQCDVVLSDPLSSRTHADLEYANGALILRDLGSANGVFVDGQRVERSVLREGSALQLGATRLRIRSLRDGWVAEQRAVLLGGQQCPGCRRYVESPGVCGKCTLAGWSEDGVPTEFLPPELRSEAEPAIDDGRDLAVAPVGLVVGTGPTPADRPAAEAPRHWKDIDTGVLYTMSEPLGAPELPPPGRRAHTRAGPFADGTRLGNRYLVLEHLGRGGFSDVYKARDEENLLQDEFALKVPHVMVDAEELQSRLQSQLKAWKVLSERRPEAVVRLVAVRTVATEGGRIVAILMEYMAGGSLEQLADREWGGFPRTREQLAQLVRLFLQVCDAVETIHAEGLLHRDLKPANMLLDAARTRCKLSDFELLQEESGTSPSLAGTPPYMAP